jgi:hypothetical protein
LVLDQLLLDNPEAAASDKVLDLAATVETKVVSHSL